MIYPENLKILIWSGTKYDVVEGITINLFEATLKRPLRGSNNSFEMHENHSLVKPL